MDPTHEIRGHVNFVRSELDISHRDDAFKKTKEFVGVSRMNRYFTTENS